MDTKSISQVFAGTTAVTELWANGVKVWPSLRTFQQEYIADPTAGNGYIDMLGILTRPMQADGSVFVAIKQMVGQAWEVDVWIAWHGVWTFCTQPGTGFTYGIYDGLNDPQNAYCYGFNYPPSEDSNFSEDPSNYKRGTFRIDQTGTIQHSDRSQPIDLPAGITMGDLVQFWNTDADHYGNTTP